MKPTRQQLLEENKHLRQIVAKLHWMARRYADGRNSGITSMFNICTRMLLALGVKLDPGTAGIIFARDAMGRMYDGLTEAEATPGTPEARGETNDQG